MNSLQDILREKEVALLTGNGFSMNFDDQFGDLYNRLYNAHKQNIKESTYSIEAKNKVFKKMLMENFKSVNQYMRSISEEEFNGIFLDGVIFAKSILNDDDLMRHITQASYGKELAFGVSPVDILKQIVFSYEDKGIAYINIEHWTILIYFYAAIRELEKDINLEFEQVRANNSFVKIIILGDINKTSFIEPSFVKAYEFVIFNGFTTYLRFLFATAIFANGKAIDTTLLSSIDKLDLIKLKSFLQNFRELITLNFDHILENLTDRPVTHLHGSFVLKNEKEYVYNQNLSLKYENQFVNYSDILLGDYFVFKSYQAFINQASGKGKNKQLQTIDKILEDVIVRSEVNAVLIFGMSAENDYHILRTLIKVGYDNNISDFTIFYSYFNKDEKKYFAETFKQVQTFGEDLQEYAKTIRLEFVETKALLQDYFLK